MKLSESELIAPKGRFTNRTRVRCGLGSAERDSVFGRRGEFADVTFGSIAFALFKRALMKIRSP